MNPREAVMPGAESAIVPSRSNRMQLHGAVFVWSVMTCRAYRGSEEAQVGVVEAAQCVVVE